MMRQCLTRGWTHGGALTHRTGLVPSASNATTAASASFCMGVSGSTTNALSQQFRFATSTTRSSRDASSTVDELKLLDIDMGKMRAKTGLGAEKRKPQHLALVDHNLSLKEKAKQDTLKQAPAKERYPEHMNWIDIYEKGELPQQLLQLIQEDMSAESSTSLTRKHEVKDSLRALCNTLMYHVPCIRKTLLVPDVNVPQYLGGIAQNCKLPPSLVTSVGVDEISIPLPSEFPVQWHAFMQQFVYTIDALLPTVEAHSDLEVEATTGSKKKETPRDKKKKAKAAANQTDVMLPVKIRDFFALAKEFERNLVNDVPRRAADLAKVEEMKFWIEKMTPVLQLKLAEHNKSSAKDGGVRLPTASECDGDRVTIPSSMHPVVQYFFHRKGISGPQTSRAAIQGIPIFSHVVEDFKTMNRNVEGTRMDFIPKNRIVDFLKHAGSCSLWIDLGYVLHAKPTSNTNAFLRIVESQHKVFLEAADHYDYVTDGKTSGFLVHYNLERFQANANAANVSQASATKRRMADVPLFLNEPAAATTGVFAPPKSSEGQQSVLFPIDAQASEKVHAAFGKTTHGINYYSFETHTMVHLFAPASVDLKAPLAKILQGGAESVQIDLHANAQKDFSLMGSDRRTVTVRTTDPRALFRAASQHDLKVVYPGKYAVTKVAPVMTFTLVFGEAITPELNELLHKHAKPKAVDSTINTNVHLEESLLKFTHEKNLLAFREAKAAQDINMAEWQSVSVGQQIKQLINEIKSQNLDATKLLENSQAGFLGARSSTELSELKTTHAEGLSYDLPMMFHPMCRHWSLVGFKQGSLSAISAEGGHLIARDQNQDTVTEAFTLKNLEDQKPLAESSSSALADDDDDEDEDDDLYEDDEEEEAGNGNDDGDNDDEDLEPIDEKR